MLPGESRLRRPDEFRDTMRQGVRCGRDSLVVHARRRAELPSRAGFIVSKAVGKAVQRNKVRRRLQEILRGRWDGIRDGRDLVLVVRKEAKDASFQELAEAVADVTARAGLTKGDNDERDDGSLEVDGGRL